LTELDLSIDPLSSPSVISRPCLSVPPTTPTTFGRVSNPWPQTTPGSGADRTPSRSIVLVPDSQSSLTPFSSPGNSLSLSSLLPPPPQQPSFDMDTEVGG
jgi:hypothetical protein